MSRDLDPLDAIDSIFTRLNAHAVRSDDVEARLERLESARIAAPVAPESAETASGVPMEPGNATEAPRPELAEVLAMEYVHGALVEIANALGVRTASDYEEGQDAPNWKLVERILATAAEVAAALRMYRKVQGVVPAERGSVVRPGPGFAAIGPLYDAATLLAWLKEGEA